MVDPRQESGWDSSAFKEYCAEGETRALELGNRGPIQFTSDGLLDPNIIRAYERFGFYVFENVIGEDELGECSLRQDFSAQIHFWMGWARVLALCP